MCSLRQANITRKFSLIDREPPYRFMMSNIELSRVVLPERYETNHVQRLERTGRVWGENEQWNLVVITLIDGSVVTWLLWSSMINNLYLLCALALV